MQILGKKVFFLEQRNSYSYNFTRAHVCIYKNSCSAVPLKGVFCMFTIEKGDNYFFTFSFGKIWKFDNLFVSLQKI